MLTKIGNRFWMEKTIRMKDRTGENPRINPSAKQDNKKSKLIFFKWNILIIMHVTGTDKERFVFFIKPSVMYIK